MHFLICISRLFFSVHNLLAVHVGSDKNNVTLSHVQQDSQEDTIKNSYYPNPELIHISLTSFQIQLDYSIRLWNNLPIETVHAYTIDKFCKLLIDN